MSEHTNKCRVAVLYGGQSGEHEISLLSAASVMTHLNRKRFEIVPVGIDKDGQWYRNQLAGVLLQNALNVRNHDSVAIHTLTPADCDVIFPVMHGPLYEDGCLQGQLQLTGLPYVGSGVLASAVAMDKELCKRVLEAAGIPVVPYLSIKRSSWQQQQSVEQARIEQQLPYPLFVKPANLGSSVGAHKVKHPEQLKAAIDDALQYDHKVLIEKAVDARDVEIGLLENRHDAAKPLTTPIGEIIIDNKYEFYDYNAKYRDPDSLKLQIPAELEPSQHDAITDYAQQAFVLLGCEGYARADLFIDKTSSEIYFNELNTIPGFTTMSMFPMMWEKAGLPYPELLEKLIDLSISRHKQQQTIKRDWRK